MRSLKGIDYAIISPYIVRPVKSALSPLYTAPPHVTLPKESSPICCFAPPVSLCYTIATNNYRLLSNQELVVESARIIERKEEMAEL